MTKTGLSRRLKKRRIHTSSSIIAEVWGSAVARNIKSRVDLYKLAFPSKNRKRRFAGRGGTGKVRISIARCGVPGLRDKRYLERRGQVHDKHVD